MSTVALAHLSLAVREQALLPDDERVQAMQRDRWSDYYDKQGRMDTKRTIPPSACS